MSSRNVKLPLLDIEDQSCTLSEVSKEFEGYLQKIKPKSIPCVKVIDHLNRERVRHEGIVEVTVFCINHKFEHKALIKYGDGEVEIIENGLSCGYGGTSPGATVNLIALLSQRARTDPVIEKIERDIVKNDKLKGKALRIEVDYSKNKIVIKPCIS